VFVRDEPGSFERAERDKADEDLFLALLAKHDKVQIPLSNKPTARSYAPTVFARDPEAKGVKRNRFAEAMDRLFGRDAICVKPYGAPSDGTFRIARGEP
jgi:hypothetical protein